MAYSTYTTEALVCGTFNRNTADGSFLLFTREAGMLYGDARSVREERSKQRFALQDFSHIRVSLVKGRSGWRIGSVESIGNHYAKATSKEARGSVVGIYRFLRRFFKGEESAQELFDYTLQALSVVSGEVSNRTDAEDIIKLRILAELGYVDKKKVPEIVLHDVLSPDESLSEKEELVISKLLSQAVDSSHL